jgi:hypothetical protein
VLDHLGPEELKAACANIAGSLLSLRWAAGPQWVDRAFSVCGGLGMGFFVAPFAMEEMHAVSPNGMVAAGFLFGLVGANLLSKFALYARGLDIGSILAAIRGGKP